MADFTAEVVVAELEVVVAEAPEFVLTIGEVHEIAFDLKDQTTEIVVSDNTVELGVSSPEFSISSPEVNEISLMLDQHTIEAAVMTSSIEFDIGVGIITPMEVIDFPSPTRIWTIDVGHMVDVVVINSAGQVVWPGEIVYGPGTQVRMEFSFPFSGQVHCYA